MKVLVVKTSSLGDVIHTLPALTDAGRAVPGIQFDWVVEPAFAEVPTWHPLVKKIIPIAWRRWRKNPWRALRSGEWQTYYRELRQEHYDCIIDAQGLIKSALVVYLAQGMRCGLNWRSAWEPLASLSYQRKFSVAPAQHAVTRVRQLFSQALAYPLTNTVADYGLSAPPHDPAAALSQTIVFLHGTTWPTKHWPESYWRELAEIISAAGFKLEIPWGNSQELQRAQTIARDLPQVRVLPQLNLTELVQVLRRARACVAVDTGLAHLAAALNIPTLSLYGPTNAALTGTMGLQQRHLAAQFPCAPCLQKTCRYPKPHLIEPPCFAQLNPQLVWQSLQPLLNLASAQVNER